MWKKNHDGTMERVDQTSPKTREPIQPQEYEPEYIDYDSDNTDSENTGGMPVIRPVQTKPSTDLSGIPKANAPRYEEKPKRKKRRKKGCLYRLLKPIVLLVCVVFLLYSALSLWFIGKMELVETGERANISAELMSDNAVQNILLIGSDSRGTEKGRSDSMILLSVNSRTHKFFLTSFMRDSYVTIPGYGNNRLNAAYSYGGPELLMDTIEQNFHVEINSYVEISFVSFVSLIDSMGGVEITVSDAEAQEINNILRNEVNELVGDDTLSDMIQTGGTYILSGKQALSYSRIRYVGNADFERTERQRTVLTKVIEKLKSPQIINIGDFMKDAAPNLKSNMSKMELYLFSLKLPRLAFYDMNQMRVPMDNAYTPVTISDMAVLQLDFQQILTLIKEEIYE